MKMKNIQHHPSTTCVKKTAMTSPPIVEFDFGFDRRSTLSADEQKPSARPRFYLPVDQQTPARRGVADKLVKLGHDILTINAILLGFGSHEKLEQDAAQMFWSERRIKYTVTPEFIVNNIPTTTNKNIDLVSWLKRPVGFGDLTDETYMEWILSKARRLFLILVRLGIPEQIFGIIDDSWDDDDLPFTIKDVSKLKLSITPNEDMDEAFWKTQYTVLLRTLNRGRHIDYHTFETVPVEVIETHSEYKLDKVAFPDGRYVNRYFARKTVPVSSQPEMMDHVEAVKSKRLDNPNIVELFASYTLEGAGHLLFFPYATMTLASFMYSPPYLYAALPPAERAVVVMRWMLSLADAVAYLHGLNLRHGDIRPSSIMVVEDGAKVLLADPGKEVGIIDTSSKNKAEADEYAAPEEHVHIFFDSFHSQSVTSLTTTNNRLSVASAQSFPKSFLGFRNRRPMSSRHSSASSSSSGDSTGSTGSSNQTIRPSPLGAHSPDGEAESKSSPEFSQRYRTSSSAGPPSPSPYTLSPQLFAPTFSFCSVNDMERSDATRVCADVFSLGCIFVDILTFLSPKRKLSQFRTRRQRANRPSLIRGRLSSISSTSLSTTSTNRYSVGPYSRSTSPSSSSSSSISSSQVPKTVQDSSFHRNLPAVHEWCNVLVRDMEKKDANNLQAVLYQDVVALCRGMLQEHPETRKTSRNVHEALISLKDREFGDIE